MPARHNLCKRETLCEYLPAQCVARALPATRLQQSEAGIPALDRLSAVRRIHYQIVSLQVTVFTLAADAYTEPRGVFG